MTFTGYAPVPGPADRESFLDAQQRHRRASLRFTALSALAIALMGIPVSAVLSPLLYAAAVLASDLVNLLVPVGDPLRWLAEGGAGSSGEPLSPAAVAVVVALLVLPGAVALLVAWLGVRRLLRRAGAGGTVLALGARPPSADIEERQVVNVVEEMAVAAGVPPPGVAILDSPVPNAAAVGSGLHDCTVVVTTGLLERLDREETQGVLGHVVASVGNGDLRIGATVLSVYQALGLVSTLLRAPFERGPRRVLRRLVRYAFGRGGADDGAALGDLLAAASGSDVEPGGDPGPVRAILQVPFVMAGMAFTMTAMIYGWVLVNPFVRRAWRARRRLADADAVRLTRNPEGLARALRAVAAGGGLVPGTEWTAHLFAFGDRDGAAGDGTAPMRTFQPSFAERVERLRAMGASAEPLPRAGVRMTKPFLLVAALASPCWLPLLAAFVAIPLVLTAISLAIDSMFLAPLVAVLHALLR